MSLEMTPALSSSRPAAADLAESYSSCRAAAIWQSDVASPVFVMHVCMCNHQIWRMMAGACLTLSTALPDCIPAHVQPISDLPPRRNRLAGPSTLALIRDTSASPGDRLNRLHVSSRPSCASHALMQSVTSQAKRSESIYSYGTHGTEPNSTTLSRFSHRVSCA